MTYDPIDTSATDNAADGTVTTNSLVTQNVNGSYLYAGAFSGNDADARLTSCLNSLQSRNGETIYLENEEYFTNHTIPRDITLVGSGNSRFGTVFSGVITLEKFADIKNVSLRGDNLNQGEIVLDGGIGGRHLVSDIVFGQITINADKSIVALTRKSSITDNGSGNLLVGNN